MRGQSLLEAVFTGFLIALSALLFVEYFGVVDLGNISIGILVVDLILIFFVGVPGRSQGSIVILVILLVLGYAAYGPYATYLREPMNNIREGMQQAPSIVGEQIHCLTLLMTNPMQYTRECTMGEQQKAHGEKPEDLGIEITNFELQPESEIYAGMPLQLWFTLENKGDYTARNLIIRATGSKYENCEYEILNLTPDEKIKFKDNLKPGETYYYGINGITVDPWKDGCNYAEYKSVIGGNIEVAYSYEYKTESFLNVEVIKNLNETTPRFRIESAKEKAAPANILMYTFIPLIWEGATESYKKVLIPVSFKNERRDGKITYRGKLVHNTVYLKEGENEIEWCNRTCKEILEPGCNEKNINDCKDDVKIVDLNESTYSYCALVSENRFISLSGLNPTDCNNTFTSRPINDENSQDCIAYKALPKVSDKSECGDNNRIWCNRSCINAIRNNYTSKSLSVPSVLSNADELCLVIVTEVESSDLNDCLSLNSTKFYRIYGNYSRNKFDVISIYVVGKLVQKSVELKCGDAESEVVVCCDDNAKVVNKECDSSKNYNDLTVDLVWRENALELDPGEKKFVYSGVYLSLKQGDWPSEFGKSFNFGIKADATYKVEIDKSEYIRINNPHYTE